MVAVEAMGGDDPVGFIDGAVIAIVDERLDEMFDLGLSSGRLENPVEDGPCAFEAEHVVGVEDRVIDDISAIGGIGLGVIGQVRAQRGIERQPGDRREGQAELRAEVEAVVVLFPSAIELSLIAVLPAREG